MRTTSLRLMLFKTPMSDLMHGRVTGRLDINLLLEQSSLSGSAAKCIKGVVKRTRLWRSEKVDVTHELIAHFLDGLEAGTSIDELIETFGDETQTAKLIRRAKLRQRPLAWHALKWFRRSIAALSVVYLLMLGYFLMGSPEVKVDYMAMFNAKALAVPEGQRAWPLYREALIELDLRREIEWDTMKPRYQDMTPYELNDEDGYLEPPYMESRWDRFSDSFRPSDPGWDEVVAFIQAHEHALELIRQGAQKPGLGLASGFASDFDPKDQAFFQLSDEEDESNKNTALSEVLLPHLGSLRMMACLLVADTYLAQSEGDGVRACQNLTAMLKLADHSRESRCLIGELVAVSIRVLAYVPMTRLLNEHPELFTDDQLRDLAHRLAAADLSFQDGLVGERLMFDDMIQRVYTDNGDGTGRMTPQGLEVLRGYNLLFENYDPTTLSHLTTVRLAVNPTAMLAIAGRRELSDKYCQMMDDMSARIDAPLWVSPWIQEPEDQWSFRERLRYLPIAFASRLPYGSPRLIAENARGLRDGMLIGIALALYRREHGDWPGALDELTRGYLPSVPLDRLTGEPVRYRITGDGPVIYSVGVDGYDDGGRLPVDANGKVVIFKAGPHSIGMQGSLDPQYDGDWMLWPVPWEE